MEETIIGLSRRLRECLNKDSDGLRRRLHRLQAKLKAGKEVEKELIEVGKRIERSALEREERLRSVPKLDFPDLPVSGRKAEIAALIRENQVVVVCGETGSGKTTQLPKICLSVGRGVLGFIGHTQPRRIAARSVAMRIAEELKQEIGQAVGYKVRFHDHTQPETLIKLMTDGILLAETQNDPYLSQYDTLIIDEAHERSLNIDFLLGYVKWLLPKRSDLKLIITSATIDPERFSRHFDGAPIIEVSGRTYPVEIRYRPIENEENDETGKDLQRAIVEAAEELHRERAGDILIFLSGEREIRETAESLRKHHPQQCEILPLYSRLSAKEQEWVFKPSGNTRIVLATNVAETSLTVPGIRCVIDTGYARISRYSHRSKLQRLPIEKISRASADQRAGRCGRVAAGICIRLYSREDFESRPEFTEPEILRTNLASVILQMKAMDLGDIARFPFVEPPDGRMIRDGMKLLQEIEAVDGRNNLTPVGRKLALLPIDPRLGRMLLAAEKENSLSEVAIIAAALSIQDPRERPLDQAQAADEKHARFKAEDSDFLAFLNVWRTFEEQKKHLSNSKLRNYCREMFLSYVRLREWHDIHAQLMQVIKGDLKMRPNKVPAQYGEIHRALLTGILSNLGFRHEQSEYLGARNLKFYIHPGSSQHKARPKWIMAAEQVETTRVYARNVAKIEPAWAEQAGAHLIKREHYDPHWERNAARAAVYERVILFGLTLGSQRKVPFEKIDPAGARDIFIRSALVEQDYTTNAPFFGHNQALLEEVGYIQQKGRRVDLIEDEEWLYGFYDQRIPATVVNGITFEQWRKEAEKKNPRYLFLTKEDLTRNRDKEVSDQDFPDEILVGGLPLRLHYRFEPGHEEDGVTAIIPLHQLNRLSGDAFQWLVPGLLREKLIGLVKGLPKSLRRNFVPVPDYADRCMASFSTGDGPLLPALSRTIKKISGIHVPDSAWSEATLPAHLKMNFRVVDDEGETLGSSRDLALLKRKYGGSAGASFKALAADDLRRSGCTRWEFGELPKYYEVIREDGVFSGFPALIDEGESVGAGLFDTERKAEQHHIQGLIRLLRIQLRKEFGFVKKNLPSSAAIELSYQNLPHFSPEGNAGRGKPDYREDTVDLIVKTVFLEAGDIRTGEAFTQRIERKREQLFSLADEAGKVVKTVMEGYLEIGRQVKEVRHPPLADDIAEQLSRLACAGFLARTPWVRLKEFSRYFKAILQRLEKAAADAVRDSQRLNELRPFWNGYWESIAKGGESPPPELDSFRWDLEEFRVSLFAQTLKTPYPISAKRLEKAWQSRTKPG